MTQAVRRRFTAVLIGDALWDFLLGLAFCLAPWQGHVVGIPVARPWAVFVVIGAGCFVFAVVLVLAARSTDDLPVTRLAAISNAVGAVVVLLALAVFFAQLQSGGVIVVIVAAVGCAVFAVLEGLAVRHRRKAH